MADDPNSSSLTGVRTDPDGGGGGGGAVTIANGSDASQGNTTDAESASGDGTVIAILKRIRTLLAGGLPAALGVGGGVKVDGSGTALPVSGSVTISDGSGPVTVDGTVTITDGSGPVSVDGTVALDAGSLAALETIQVASLPATPAGTNTIGSFKPATYATVASGELQGSASALQLPSVACTLVRFTALASNAGKVYLGGSGVTVPNGTTDTTSGLEIAAGGDTGWIPVSNLNLLYRICENAGDDLTYLALV